LKLALVVNPHASSVTPKRRAAAEAALSAGHDVTVLETEGRDHATELARRAVAGGAEVVVALGGDGTVNEVANALIGTKVALAALPGGSTNVFTRTIGFPRKFDKAVAALRTSLDRGAIRGMGAGNVNGRRFLFHLGIGFDAAVVAQVERRASLKRTIGQAVFVYATFATLLRHFDRKRPGFTMRFPDGTHVKAFYAVAMSSSPYTYLGRRPLTLTRDAGPGRGLVAVTVTAIGPATVSGLFLSALGNGGRLRRSHHVDHRTDLTEFTVASRRPFPYQVDGDYLGQVEELSVIYEPRAVRVVVPLVTPGSRE
jgi:diacylglycerol kinase family enzyme